MKVFVYDEKHEQVRDELSIEDKDIEVIRKLIVFLEKNHFTNRYNNLVLADGYDYNGELIEFN